MGPNQKSFSFRMRLLHRYVGFFAMGLTLVYALSGMTLIFRDTNFMQVNKTVHKQLTTQMDPDALGDALGLRDFKVEREDDRTIVFNSNGSYDKATGEAAYTVRELRFPLNKFAMLHKVKSHSPFHWFGLLYGAVLLVLAISAPCMFPRKSGLFWRGITCASLGIVAALILILAI